MIDFEAPSPIKARVALRDETTRTRLVKFPRLFTDSDAAAEDLMAEALLVKCDPQEGRPWDEARASFVTHMRDVAAGARAEVASEVKAEDAELAATPDRDLARGVQR